MRVQMWCDMEGVAGIVRWDQVNAGRPQYEEGRILYTNEINAAVRGAKAAGATEIVVLDGHGAGGDCSFNSFVKTALEPGAEYVFGHRWGCYIDLLRQGCDALLLPGAHAMAGTPDGVLCHTMSSANWVNATINGVKTGESGIIAAIAGSFDTPVVFVSGDAATCKEVAAFVGPTVVQACVKVGLNRFAARCLAPADACALIERKVFESLRDRERWPSPYKTTAPVEFRIELATPDQSADQHGKIGVEVVDGRTVISRADTMWQAWDQIWPRKIGP